MASTWALFRRIAAEKLSWKTESIIKPRIEVGLSLGLRAGSMMRISSVDAILAGGKLQARMPSMTELLTVVDYGKFTVHPFGPFNIHRFYLAADSGELYTLQIVNGENGSIDDLKLFSLYDEIDDAEWDFWLNDHDGYIGMSPFRLKDNADGTPGTEYYRAWDPVSAHDETVVEENSEHVVTHIAPYTFTEQIHGGPFGTKVRTVDYHAMLYGRNVVNEVDEYCMVAVANERDEKAVVQVIIGLPVRASEITVLS